MLKMADKNKEKSVDTSAEKSIISDTENSRRKNNETTSHGNTATLHDNALTNDLPAILGDAALYSYACICAISLRRLFEDDWHKQFKAQIMSKLLCHMKQPPQVSVSITAILEGVGIDETDPFVKVLMEDPVLEESCLPVLADLLMLVVKDGCYDARVRVLIKRIAWYVHVRWELVEELEGQVAESLSAQGYKLSEEEEKERKRQALKAKAKRYGLIGLATVGGGVLIGLTGGLAAPLVAAGAGAIIGGASAAVLGSAAGIAIIGSLFGVAGAGLTGYKMKRRVGQVEEFGFDLLTHSLQANQHLSSSSQSLQISSRSTPCTTPSPVRTPHSRQSSDSNLNSFSETNCVMDPLNVCQIVPLKSEKSDTPVTELPEVMQIVSSNKSVHNAQDGACHLRDDSSSDASNNVACQESQDQLSSTLTSEKALELQLSTNNKCSENSSVIDSDSLCPQSISDTSNLHSASCSEAMMSSGADNFTHGDISNLLTTQAPDYSATNVPVSDVDNHAMLSANNSNSDNTETHCDEIDFESSIEIIDSDCETDYHVKRAMEVPLLTSDMDVNSETCLSVLNLSRADMVSQTLSHSQTSQNCEDSNLPITSQSKCHSSQVATDIQRTKHQKLSSASSGESEFLSEDFVDLTTEDDGSDHKSTPCHHSSSQSSSSSVHGSQHSLSQSSSGHGPSIKDDRKLPHQLHVSIAVTGWLNTSMTDFRYPWRNLAHSVEQYSLRWESKYLLELGKALDYIVSFAVSYATQEALKYTVLSGLIAAVAWPVTLVSAAGVIDNPWSVCIQRAHSTGRQLAEVLLAREQGRRPVTLIGYSMGARVIFSCLEELAKRKGSEGIVEDVILLGAPISGNVKKWKPLARVIAGQIINGYCRGDWLLKFLHRTASAQFSIAGLKAVRWENRRMCNMDLSDLVTGHMDYMNKLDEILNLIGIRMRTEEIDQNVCVAEEVQEDAKKVYDKTNHMTIM